MSLALGDVGGFSVGFDTVPNPTAKSPPPHTHTHTKCTTHISGLCCSIRLFFVSSLGIIRLPRNDSLHVHVH